MTGSDDTVSIAEAARRLGIHRHTLGRWITLGRVSYVRVGPLRRIRVAEIARLTADIPATDPDQEPTP
jgi:excisionase family DNA binding protein